MGVVGAGPTCEQGSGDSVRTSLHACCPFLLAAPLSTVQSMNPVAAFLPFFVHRAVTSTRFKGEVAHYQTTMEWRNNKFHPVRRLVYSPTTGWHAGQDHHHGPEVPEMQTYAGFRYRRDLLQPLKGSWTGHPQKLESHLVHASGATVEPCEMTPAFAWEITESRLRDLETGIAADSLQRLHSAVDTRNIETNTKYVSRRQEMMLLPVYIFETEYAGRLHRIFVNGVNGKTNGATVYSPGFVGLLGMGGTAAVGYALEVGAAVSSPTNCLVRLCLAAYWTSGRIAKNTHLGCPQDPPSSAFTHPSHLRMSHFPMLRMSGWNRCHHRRGCSFWCRNLHVAPSVAGMGGAQAQAAACPADRAAQRGMFPCIQNSHKTEGCDVEANALAFLVSPARVGRAWI